MHPLVINPKSVTLSELYGAYDLSTFEWADGILSTLFKQSAESDKPDEKVKIIMKKNGLGMVSFISSVK